MSVIGYANIINIQSKTAETICLKKIRVADGYKCFVAYANNGTQLGEVLFRWLRKMPDGSIGNEQGIFLPDHPIVKMYSQNTQIFIDNLQSPYRNCYKGVGKALIQSVIEYSYHKACGGRISLEAAYASHGFYYKMGMRTRDPAVDGTIAANVKKIAKGDRSSLNTSLGMFAMAFSERVIRAWRMKIFSCPITCYLRHK
jgi:hypothetical protein